MQFDVHLEPRSGVNSAAMLLRQWLSGARAILPLMRDSTKGLSGSFGSRLTRVGPAPARTIDALRLGSPSRTARLTATPGPTPREVVSRDDYGRTSADSLAQEVMAPPPPTPPAATSAAASATGIPITRHRLGQCPQQAALRCDASS